MRASLVLLCASVASCVPRLIPGTEIDDTDDNQRILGVVEHYRRAVEGRDASSTMALISQGFYDDAGTPEPSDDHDAEGLKKRLAAEFEKRVQQVRLELTVKKIFAEGDNARVRYFYTLRYQVGEEWKQEIDAKEMILRREGGVWKITGGI